MKNKRFFCILLCLMLTVHCLPIHAEIEPEMDLSVKGGSHTIDGQVPILGTEQLIKNANAVLLYEINTDTIMHAWNADEPRYPASLVKIMTALLVLENCNLEDVVTVSAGAVQSVDKGAVSSHLVPDEVISVENLMYCMLVDSANDAAAVLAEHVSGTQKAFVDLMNQRAADLGCTKTHFVNPHGLHDDTQLTTARDVGRILREAMKHEAFRTIFGTVNYTVPFTNQSNERALETGNFLMNLNSMEIYYDARVTGGRTGVTQDGNRCIAATAEQNGLSFISVVMGAASEYEEEGSKVRSFGGFPETTQLLNMGFEGYRAAKIIFEGQALKQYSVGNGESDVVVYPQISISTVLPKTSSQEDLSFRFHENGTEMLAPIEKDQNLGSVEIWNGSICIGNVDLFAMNRVAEKKSADDSAADTSEKSSGNQILMISGCVIGGFFICLILIRLVIRYRKFARRRRNRMNRRRSR